jgi:predicted dehydrogenase
VLNAELDGGRPATTPFRLEIVGTEGSLTLSGSHPYGFQAGDLTLVSSAPFDPLEAPAAPGLAGPTANVGEVYARFAEDIRTGERRTPDFVHAAKLHALIASIKLAAANGQRQTVEDGPQD